LSGGGRLLRYAISSVACAALLWLINWRECIQTLKLANEYWLAVVLVLNLCDRVFMVYKWMILLKGSGLQVSLGMALRSYFVGSFADVFLPTSIGGDIVRVTWLARVVANTGKIISSVIVERLLGAVALALVAVASTVLLAHHIAGASFELMLTLGAMLAISLTAIAVMFSHGGHNMMRPLIAAIPFRGLSEVAEKARTGVLDFRSKPVVLGAFLLLSVCEQGFPIVANVALARAFSISLSLEWALIGMPIILAASRMPISVAGIGVSEGLYALVFSYAGIPVTQSVMIAVTGRVLVLLSSLPGAWWTVSPSKAQTTPLAIHGESVFRG
jgi:uncharacterized membrane protein YbhN (UPF0104 family)